MFENNGNKCGKCQNHDYEVLKKGHARDCPFKRCECLKCRLLDARSDILQVISGKETKLKGTKKDPNCGFCQNHGVKILRKGHVRSCGFGQERHFKLQNCFDCEVHYIRNEVNRLQIKMRRAMKEDRLLSEEQRKTAREPITRDEVEKVCDMARSARKKRETILGVQQVAKSSALHQQHSLRHVAAGVSGQQGLRSNAQTAKNSHMLAHHHHPEPIQLHQPTLEHYQQQQQQQQQQHMQASLQTPQLKREQLDHHQQGVVDLVNYRHRPSIDANLDVEVQVDVEDYDNQAANVWRPWSQQQVVEAAHQQQQYHNNTNHHQLQPHDVAITHQEQQAQQQPMSFDSLPELMHSPGHTTTTTSMDNGANNHQAALDLAEPLQHELGAQLQRQQLFNAIFRLFFTQFAQNVQTPSPALDER